jgi:hypothetical protein
VATRLDDEAHVASDGGRPASLLRRIHDLITGASQPDESPLEGAYIVEKGEPRATQVVFGDPSTARRDQESMSRTSIEPLIAKWSRIPEEDLSKRAAAVETAASRYAASLTEEDGRRAS